MLQKKVVYLSNTYTINIELNSPNPIKPCDHRLTVTNEANETLLTIDCPNADLLNSVARAERFIIGKDENSFLSGLGFYELKDVCAHIVSETVRKRKEDESIPVVNLNA